MLSDDQRLQEIMKKVRHADDAATKIGESRAAALEWLRLAMLDIEHLIGDTREEQRVDSATIDIARVREWVGAFDDLLNAEPPDGGGLVGDLRTLVHEMRRASIED